MRETEVTVVGNVVKSPQRNRTPGGSSVTNFRLASTPRRFDKESQSWVDKPTLFIDVECWGDLGGNVSYTVSKGDPVIVFGELAMDEWETDQGRRSRVKIRAEAVGPDLAKGMAEFRRSRREQAGPGEAPPGDENSTLAEQSAAERLIGAAAEEPGGEEYTGLGGALYELDSELGSEPAHA